MKNKQKKKSQKKTKNKYTFLIAPQVDKIRIHKSSFEKIKITIKSQENISFPPKTALVDLQYIRSVYARCERSVTSGGHYAWFKCTDTSTCVSTGWSVNTWTNFGYKFKPAKVDLMVWGCKMCPKTSPKALFLQQSPAPGNVKKHKTNITVF